MSLSTYGFDSYWQSLFEKYSFDGLPGRVTSVFRGWCDVATESGTTRVRSGSADVCTGDWVVVGTDTVLHVLPRRTAVVRASAGQTSASQILASNVDTVVVTVAADTELDLGRVERFVALPWASGATPIVALTKSDKASESRYADVSAASPGVHVAELSAYTGNGLAEFLTHLTGTIALIGPSGSGKSTLANRMIGDDVLATGHVRSGDAKGRHVTVRRELVPLPIPGTTVIDTPGLRSVGVLSSDDGLSATFSDIEDLAAHCRFADCAHLSEPGCAVRENVDPRRVANYQRLVRENDWATTRHDVRANQARLAEAKQISKAQRQLYKSRNRPRQSR
ncbi:ribosome small subunit-dependent GTPase A [Rhodococcus sp. B10]|uniref:ribosome small subunit-dependent GTPase A n=1 Tax=Rhodococcus sp. B10 TaxID=2695876 RepID=UPI00142FCE6E|nr:Small ribosomal subunit biogenesis GTPase RsgA [Rhodococcus sp. B10]